MFTSCPQCSTSFRVGPAQLQVANGKVRCGQCQSVFSALAYLREAPEQTPRAPEPQAPPPIAEREAPPVEQEDEALAGREEQPPVEHEDWPVSELEEQPGAGRGTGYAEELVNTDQWEILTQPEREFPSELSDSGANRAALENEGGAEDDLQHDAAVGDLSDEDFDSAAEEALLEAQMELDADERGDAASGRITENPEFELDGDNAGELPDATFGTLEEGLEEDELGDFKFEDAAAAELAIEEALQAAMAEEGFEAAEPRDVPPLTAEAAVEEAEEIPEAASFETSEDVDAEELTPDDDDLDELEAPRFEATGRFTGEELAPDADDLAELEAPSFEATQDFATAELTSGTDDLAELEAPTFEATEEFATAELTPGADDLAEFEAPSLEATEGYATEEPGTDADDLEAEIEAANFDAPEQQATVALAAGETHREEDTGASNPSDGIASEHAQELAAAPGHEAAELAAGSNSDVLEVEEEPLLEAAPALDDEWELGLLEAYARDNEEPPPSPSPDPASRATTVGQEIPDDDLDDFLFDDEHGIQEYLEQQHSAENRGPAAQGQEESDDEPSAIVEEDEPEGLPQPVAAPTPEPEHSTPPLEEAIATPEPVATLDPAPGAAPEPVQQLDTQPEPTEVEDLSTFHDFDLAAESALESNRDTPPEPAAAAPAAPHERVEPELPAAPASGSDTARSRAMIAQELSLLDLGRASQEQDARGEDELVFEEDQPPAQSGLTADVSPVGRDALESEESEPTGTDDDPLNRPGSEEYTFPLYFEQEKASQVMSGVDSDADEADQTEFLVAGSQEAQSDADPDSTMMMRLPLGDSVEFEVPIEDEEDETYLLDVDEAEVPEGPELWPELPTAKTDRKLSWRHRGRRVMWSALSIVLLLALGTQLVHYNRESLVIRPTIGPWLQNVYSSVGLKLAPPGDLDQYEIRLHVAPAIQGKIQISATLANLADHVQPYPLVRLVLEDRWQEAVGNLIVEPRDYLAQAAASELMAPKQRVEAQIEVVDPGPTAESYKLDICLRHSQGTLRCADDS